MPAIHITDIEAAINYWRARQPSPDGIVLSARSRARGVGRLVRPHARYAVHCHLLDQPRRRLVQGLRAQLC